MHIDFLACVVGEDVWFGSGLDGPEPKKKTSTDLVSMIVENQQPTSFEIQMQLARQRLQKQATVSLVSFGDGGRDL
jgi:hypothetical protein